MSKVSNPSSEQAMSYLDTPKARDGTKKGVKNKMKNKEDKARKGQKDSRPEPLLVIPPPSRPRPIPDSVCIPGRHTDASLAHLDLGFSPAWAPNHPRGTDTSVSGYVDCQRRDPVRMSSPIIRTGVVE